MLGYFGLALPCAAQIAVAPSEIAAANQIMDSKVKQNSLKCELTPWRPFLDFTFRFEAGFLLSTRLGQFAQGDEPITYLRIIPQGATPVILRSVTELPTIPADMARKMDLKSLGKIRMTTSGAFNIGEGRYSVELVLLNKQGQSCYRRWNLQAVNHARTAVPLVMEPRSVTSVVHSNWDGKLDPNGVRLSILLDAAPMNPLAPKLHAWDRALILQTLASVLKRIPCQSVEIVAFNLEQQREVFRQEKFDAEGFEKLATTLKHLELTTVSVQSLQRGSAGNFLSKIVREQISEPTPSDVVIFLGPATRFDQKPLAENLETAGQRFFYFELHWPGAHFPDSIEYLTKELHGSTFVITSATELASAIQKTMVKIQPSETGEPVPKRE